MATLTLCVVANGQRRELVLPENATLRELKGQVAMADGIIEDAQAVEALFGPFIFRGKKLEDSATLGEAGVQNRDKLMVSYAPEVKEVIAQIMSIRKEKHALEGLREAGETVHPDLITRLMVKLDAIVFDTVTGDAKDVLRSLRKRDLASLHELEAGGQQGSATQ
ncbi:hypothetical protein T492DRAFT_1102110 [Pavlovales sp. CCMP2436]|nr:hypothetical protein T492DRAFT_1102110 [Pavlovales sp. CCMP2436]|mmetsp:Transcript_5084/g.13174  ORF Transcript_5084/g.13174 Transcript_5084/m.13174 type:complete len:165 (-) Transcript_5084:257-751(-)